MAGNQEIIDSVVDPIAIEQFNQLKAAAAETTEQMIIATKAAINLNNATGGSQSFSIFKKNADATNQALSTVIANSQKAQQAEDKARAYKAEMDEKALNKYLTLLSKQEAARQAQDAKEIAAAERKAAKMAQIQAEADAKAQAAAAKRVSVIGETIIGGQGENAPDPNKTGPAVNADDISRAQSANAASSTASAAAAEENTAAIQAETVALTEQEAVLNAIIGTQAENQALLVSLTTERAANLAELKSLNLETAAGAERAAVLTGENIRLAVSIQQVKTALTQQAKEELAVQGSESQLDASLSRLRLAYSSLSEEEQKNAAVGGVLLAQIEVLDAKTKELALTQGKTNKEVGAYEKAIAKFTNGSQLAATGVQVLARSLVRLVVQFALFSVAFKAIELIYDYIKALDVFNPIATESERAQKGLSEAFASADYSKAVQGVEELASNLDLVKNGVIDSDVAINKYNETIGKTFGYVDNLNAAQQGFIDHKDAYIKAILQEAAAQAILADSGKELAELGKKQQDLRNANRRLSDNTETDIFGQKVAAQAKDNAGLIATHNKEIADLEKRKQEIITNTIGALDEVRANTPNKGNTGTDPAGDLRIKLLNDSLEREKIIAQNKINNDKLSYAERIRAVEEFNSASAQIETNNFNNEISKLPKNDARIEEIEKSHSNKLLQIQIERDNQLQTLQDKAFKQDQEFNKKQLENQKEALKSVIDDPLQSLEAKLAALSAYDKKSRDIADINQKEQLREAGKNDKSQRDARAEHNNALLKLDNEYTAARLKLYNEELAKVLKSDSNVEEQAIIILDAANKTVLAQLDANYNAKKEKTEQQYDEGKIKLKKYNRELLSIDDDYQIARLNQEILNDEAIISIRKAKKQGDIDNAKKLGATPDQINDITATNDKAISSAQDKLADDKIKRDNAIAKRRHDNSKNDKQDAIDNANDISQAVGYLQNVQDEASRLIQANYQKEIDLLEAKKQLIDDQSKAEIDAVNGSVLSEADKQRKINIINAQAAQQKKQIDDQEKKAKQKAAAADKAISIASIIENTAVAITKTLAESGAIFGIPLVPVIAALGAIQLAAAIATPLPKFEKGGITKGGPFIWGEKGMEIAIEPGGKMYASPGTASIGKAPAGTRIIPNHMIRPDRLSYSGGQQVPWKEVLSELRKNRPVQQKRPVNRINVNVDSYNQKFYR